MTMDRRMRSTCLIMVVLLSHCAGCASPSQFTRLGRKARDLGPIGTTSTASQPASRPVGYDDAAWTALLLRHVAPGWTAPPDPNTRELPSAPWPQLVEYREILLHPEDLNAYLAVLARTGPASTPQQFPGNDERLAYYLNAYNACAIRAALAEYPSQTAYAPDKPLFEQDWYCQVDGRRANLADLRQEAQQAAGGNVRFFFGLSAAAVGSPPLAPHPYRAADVQAELDAQAKLCLAMPQFLTVAHEQQQLRLWCRIIRNEELFATWYEKLYGTRPTSLLNVVLELAPPARRELLNKAVGYKIVEMPFDRTLNDLAVRLAAATPKKD